MRTWFVAFCLFAATLSFGQAGHSATNSFVLTKDSAYLINPPKMIGSDLVMRFVPSPSGQYALVWTIDLKGLKMSTLGQPNSDQNKQPEIKLSVLDTSKDALTPVAMGKEDVGQSMNVHWSHDSAQAYFAAVDVSDPNAEKPSWSTRVLRISMSDASVKTVFHTEPATEWNSPTVYCSPTQPIVLVSEVFVKAKPSGKAVSTVKFFVFDGAGNMVRKSSDSMEGFVPSTGEWTQDGRNLMLQVFKRKPDVIEAAQSLALYDPTIGKLAETQEKFKPFAPNGELDPLVLEPSTSVISVDKSDVTVKPLWVRSVTQSDVPRGLVAPDTDGQFSLMQGGKKVFYVAKSRLYSCELERVDLQVYLDAKAAADRSVALSRAKQVALGIILFASDNNDNYPTASGFQDAVKPYLKNDQLLDGFVYTFKGGSASDVQNPSSTELGYIDINGGRVVAYVDGHVKFVKGS